jgi:hypothetical protein
MDIKKAMQLYELRAYLEEKRAEQSELEERYNPYHNPTNGRFTNSSGGGMGGLLYVARGQKGKGVLASVNKGYSDEEIDEMYRASKSSNGNVAQQATNMQNGLTSGNNSGSIKNKAEALSSTLEDGQHGDCGNLHDSLKNNPAVDYREVQALDSPLSEEKIIDKLGGGDMTKGSCASLALAYCANKAGYDVTDFRGGESCYEVASGQSDFSKNLPGAKVMAAGPSATPGAKMIFIDRNIAEGEEYMVGAAKHTAIVKKAGGKLYYLELQEEPGVRYKNRKGVKGWRPMTKASTFKKRFHDDPAKLSGGVFYGGLDMVKVSDVPKATGFREMMGYINTAPSSQQKGVKGHAK